MHSVTNCIGHTCGSDLQTAKCYRRTLFGSIALCLFSVLVSSKHICSWPLLGARCLANGRFGRIRLATFSIMHNQAYLYIIFNTQPYLFLAVNG